MKKNNKDKLKVSGVLIAGLGALAGAYFLYGTDVGKKKRQVVKSWMLKAKGEILEKIEAVKDLSEEKYMDTLESVLKKYRKLKAGHEDEIADFYRELVSYWKLLKKKMDAPPSVKKRAKKSPKTS